MGRSIQETRQDHRVPLLKRLRVDYGEHPQQHGLSRSAIDGSCPGGAPAVGLLQVLGKSYVAGFDP